MHANKIRNFVLHLISFNKWNICMVISLQKLKLNLIIHIHDSVFQ